MIRLIADSTSICDYEMSNTIEVVNWCYSVMEVNVTL